MKVRTTALPCSALLIAAVAWGVFVNRSPDPTFDPSTDAASICTTERPFSASEVLGAAALRVTVAVPVADPLPGLGNVAVYRIAKDDIVQVDVGTPRPGAVAVHGLLDAHRIRLSGTSAVKFQAKYTGRFPLHFHGDDGSHFELVVFEVR